jgi:Ran GTPase-activating protein (RanGAP) involved in mRNA processing and transport
VRRREKNRRKKPLATRSFRLMALQLLSVALLLLCPQTLSSVAVDSANPAAFRDKSFPQHDTHMSTEAAAAAAAAAAAGELDLSHSHMGPCLVSELVTQLCDTNIPSALSLQECSLGDDGAEQVVASPLISNPDGISTLSLRHNHITAAGARAIFTHLRTAADRLSELVLDYNPISDAGVQPLPALLKDSNNGQLESLSLRYCGITSAGCRSISSALTKAQVKGADRGVRHLSLAGNAIGDAGAKAIAAALKLNVSLEELDLTGCSIGAEGCSAIAEALLSNTHLKHLVLDYNNIGSEGAAALAVLLSDSSPSHLERLDLSNTHIGTAGACALASGFSCIRSRGRRTRDTATAAAAAAVGKRSSSSSSSSSSSTAKHSVTALDLSGNGIGCEGCSALAAAIAKNCPLVELDLSGNPLLTTAAAQKASSSAGSSKTSASALSKQAATKVVSSFNKLYAALVDDGYKAELQQPGGSGVLALARALRQNTLLRRLGLAHTGIDKRIARRLTADIALNSGTLRWLDVSSNAALTKREIDSIRQSLDPAHKRAAQESVRLDRTTTSTTAAGATDSVSTSTALVDADGVVITEVAVKERVPRKRRRSSTGVTGVFTEPVIETDESSSSVSVDSSSASSDSSTDDTIEVHAADADAAANDSSSDEERGSAANAYVSDSGADSGSSEYDSEAAMRSDAAVHGGSANEYDDEW